MPKLENRDPSVASVTVVDANRVIIVPKLDGRALLKVSRANGQRTEVEINVADGEIVSLSKALFSR